MKIKEVKELKNKTVKELLDMVSKKKLDLLKSQVKISGAKNSNLKTGWSIKKEIAQILTIIKTKEEEKSI